jgi:hypothetical protein
MTAADVTGQSLRDVRVFMAGVVRIPAPDLAGTTRCAAAIVASGWAAVPGFASFPAGERCRLKPDSSAACRNPANSHGNAIASSLQRHGRFTQDPGPKRLIRDVVFMATFTCIVCCLVCYITSRQENRRFTQRGAAATEGSRRDKCVRSRLGTPSRRAERGDFVAQRGGEMQKPDQRPNNSKAKVTKDLMICSFSADHPILYSTGRTLVTN